MKTNQSYCLRGRHYSRTVDKANFEKVNPKLKNSLKLSKQNLVIALVINPMFLLSK